jgi:hypothetical protein
MPRRTDVFDLGRLSLSSGEGRRLDLHVHLADLTLGGERYAVEETPIPVRLDVSRTTGQGYARLCGRRYELPYRVPQRRAPAPPTASPRPSPGGETRSRPA